MERSWKIEGLFAEAKAHHGLLRVKYRGLSKVQIQFYMTAMVQNFKRLATYSHQLNLKLRYFLWTIYEYRPKFLIKAQIIFC